MQHKVILVVLDGLNFPTAQDCMGYLQGLCEMKQATLYKMQCELPSMSRPLYECILTGVPPITSGIRHNQVTRNSNQQSIFSIARQAQRRTAAAAYHWFSELYNRTPYDPVRDRYTADESQLIQYGCFYHLDHYPDSHLFLDAEWLRRSYDPDFLLVHPMNIDDAGHKAGVDSSLYRNTTRHADISLAEHLPRWMEAGYQIIITADHGMNDDNSHGGILPEEREIPFYVVGSAFSHDPTASPQQLQICGTVCHLMGITDHDKPVCEALLH